MTTYSLRIIALFYKVLFKNVERKAEINKQTHKVRKVIDIIT